MGTVNSRICFTLATLYFATAFSLPILAATAEETKSNSSKALESVKKQTSTTKSGRVKRASSKSKGSAPIVTGDRIVLQAMKKELDRSFSRLKNAGDAPLYFLAYRIYDVESVDIKGSYGGLDTISDGAKYREVSLDLRVGSPAQDNTHETRGNGGIDVPDFMFHARSVIPIEDNEDAIRVALWTLTDKAFKQAQQQYAIVKADRDVKVEEEDTSADFSVESPQKFVKAAESLSVDKELWRDRVRRMSRIYRQYRGVIDSSVDFNANRTTRYLVSSEGTEIEDEHVQYRVMTSASTIAPDGMRLWLYEGVEAPTVTEIPDEAKIEQMVHTAAKDLEALRVAPVAEPYVGPAILKAKAAGVFFHETFGHRIEGHRQKSEDEGRTFAKKVGTKIMPEFITVTDDPTRQKFGKKALNGFYRFDDEGVPAQNVTLVDKGVLKTFLMGRSPIKDFSKSNGHGRSSAGSSPVARQANLIVDCSKKVTSEKLREMLIAEAKKQGRSYGLIFDEIAGGFTITQSYMPQVYKLLPLRVWKVYTDGRPDELLRGVDLVGTPLNSLERIVCSAEDDDTFNGSCGAESGWVPVSATSPSLLVDIIEVERQHKAQDKPPILPSPFTATDATATTAPVSPSKAAESKSESTPESMPVDTGRAGQGSTAGGADRGSKGGAGK